MAKIEVDVGVKTSRFKQGLDAMRAQANSFSAQLSKTGALLGGIAAHALAGSMDAMQKSGEHAEKLAAKFKRVADTTGETTKAIQELNYMATLTGGDLDEVVNGLGRAAMAAEQAVTGNETFAKLFQDLGINAAEFAQALPREQMDLLGGSFQKAAEKGEPLLLYFKLLGKTVGETKGDLISIIRQFPDLQNEIKKGVPTMPRSSIEEFDKIGNAEQIKSLKKAVASAENPYLAKAVEENRALAEELQAARDKVTSMNLPPGVATAATAAAVAAAIAASPHSAKAAEFTAKAATWKKEPDSPSEKKKRIGSSLSLSAEERAAFIEQERELKFRNDLDAEKDPKKKLEMLRREQALHKGRSLDAGSAGNEREMFEARIKASGMTGDIGSAIEAAYKMPSRSVVASSLQEVGGGGRGVIFGGADQAIRQQANDVSAIRAMLSSFALPGREWKPQTESFKQRR